MVALIGTYQNGFVKLDKDYSTDEPVRVIVTFLEEIELSSEERILLSDFSFSRSQKNLENYKGSLGDSLIEERRTEL